MQRSLLSMLASYNLYPAIASVKAEVMYVVSDFFLGFRIHNIWVSIYLSIYLSVYLYIYDGQQYCENQDADYCSVILIQYVLAA